jgi:hypothetical protein
MRVLVVVLTLAVSLPLSAQPLKNVQILTGLSRPEVQRVMNEMRAGLGVHCHYCHANDDTHGASDTKPQKARAREMMRMVIDLNTRHFGGQPVVTCFTCHNGKPRPALLPPLPQPVPPEPAAVEAKSFPPAAAVIQKYVAAVGRELPPGTPRLFRGTRMTPSGTTIGMTLAQDGEKLRADLTLPDGSTATQALDANGGWARDKNGVRVLQPDDVIAARMGARPFAPFHTSSIGDDAKVVDSETLGGRSAWVMATPAARYSFDAASGLLLRRVVYFDSPMGRIPEQTDFDDYRDVGGAKLPFLTRIALVDPWLSGTRQAKTIQVGVTMPEDFWRAGPESNPRP